VAVARPCVRRRGGGDEGVGGGGMSAGATRGGK